MHEVEGSAAGQVSAAGVPDGGSRWLAVGWSTRPDPADAGRQAACSALRGAGPKLLIVFCTATRDPVATLAGITAVAGSVPLVGCSAESVITPDGPTTDGVAVVALGGPGLSVATAAGPAATSRRRQAGAEVAACFTEVADHPYRILLLLTDGRTTEQEVILSGVYGVVGASLPLIGGSASPARGGDRTFQLYGTQVLTDAVLGAVIASNAPVGVGLRHGWRRTGDPLMVTHSAGCLVKTLNDRPALPTYLQRLGAPPQAYRDPAAFQEFARTHPIGVSRRDREDLRDVSFPGYLREGWLHSSGEIAEGGLVWLMESDPGAVLEAAGDATRDAVGALGGRPALGLLAFDCVSRSGILHDDGTRREIRRIAEAGAPVVGMYTWGEIARIRGINAYHNLTLAVLALS